MRIVLGGYIVGYPLGGMTWHHLNYVLGLRALGHDVTFLEDGAYLPPFNPAANTYGDPTYGIDYLKRTLASYGLSIPWHYRYGAFSAGLDVEEARVALRSADLFIAVSGVTPIEWYDLPRRTLVIDTDPVFTQLRMTGDAGFLAYFNSFTHVATFGRLIGTPDSPLPTHGIDWIPTNQPVALDAWPAAPTPADAPFTTLGKWEHAPDRVVEFDGRRFASDKGSEYEKMIDLPRRLAMPVEMRMAAIDSATRARFESHGWTFADPVETSSTCGRFADYVRRSAGEFTVCKQIYAGVPSGWFSDRSACFLATGRPVVTQASGFERWLPTGEGLFTFTTVDEAAVAIDAIRRDPRRHGGAARRIAERHFDARLVLSDLLARVA